MKQEDRKYVKPHVVVCSLKLNNNKKKQFRGKIKVFSVEDL